MKFTEDELAAVERFLEHTSSGQRGMCFPQTAQGLLIHLRGSITMMRLQNMRTSVEESFRIPAELLGDHDMTDLWKDDPTDDRTELVKEVEGPIMAKATKEDIDKWLADRNMAAVPLEPTPEMIREAMSILGYCFEEREGVPIELVGISRPLHKCSDRFREIQVFKAMVKAAQDDN